MILKILKSTMLMIFLGISLFSLSSCDILARFKCDWYIVPDMSQKDSVEPGWVPVCIRNYKINKQKCFLKAKLPLAEHIYGKSLRYYDIEINTKSFPREILSAEACQQ